MVKKKQADTVTLIAPDGAEYQTSDRAEITRLTRGYGYSRKADASARTKQDDKSVSKPADSKK